MHPAPQIDPHGCGHDGALCGDDAADGRADSRVDIRHRGDVPVNDRQLRHVLELLPGGSLEIVRPYLDGDAAAGDFLEDGHGRGWTNLPAIESARRPLMRS